MPHSLAHQLKRIETLVAATTYTFPKEDSIGLPNPLPPARKIGLGRRSLTGQMAEGKVKGPGPFESALERDFFLLLDFDPQVREWAPQPVTLRIPKAAGRRATKFTPDVLVDYYQRVKGVPVQPVLFEIKYREELKRDWAELKPKFVAARQYAKSQGWRFALMTDRQIRTPMLANAKFFLPYGRYRAPDADAARVMELLHRYCDSTPARLMALCSDNPTDQARYLTTIWVLIAARIIEVDFNFEVAMDSRIHLAHEYHGV